MSIHPSNDPGASVSPELVEDIRFWAQHPALDMASLGLSEAECTVLRRDAENCAMLLKQTGLNPGPILGAGTYGIVFKVFDHSLNCSVAIKMLRPSAMVTDNAKARFKVEARTLAQLDIPGVVRLYQYQEVQSVPYIKTQLIDGPSLDQLSETLVHPGSTRLACRLLVEICRSIHVMHLRGFIHRDLKPTNILLRKNDEADPDLPFRPVVTDFGFAKDLGEIKSYQSSGSSIVGTIRYMAPEQVLCKSSEVSALSDIFSLGVILYELLAKRGPFDADSKIETLFKIANVEPPPIRKLRLGLSRDLEAVVNKCLQKDPSQRYQTAADLGADLERYLEGLPTHARSVGLLRGLWLGVINNKVLSGLWLVLIMLLVWLGLSLQHERELNSLLEATNDQATLAYKRFYNREAEKAWDTPGKMTDRLILHLEALEFFRWKARTRNYDGESRHELSTALHWVSSAYTSVGQPDKSNQVRRECLNVLEGLVKDFPENDQYRFDLFTSLILVGYTVKEPTPCLEWEQALREINQLCGAQSENASFLDARNSIQMAIAQICVDRNVSLDRAKSYAEAILINSQQLLAKYPDKFNYWKYVPHSWSVLARLAFLENEDHAKVIQLFDRAIKAQLQLSSHFDRKGPWLVDEFHLRRTFIDALSKMDAKELLVKQVEEQLSLLESIIFWYPETREYVGLKAYYQLLTAHSLFKLDKTNEGQELLRAAKETYSSIADFQGVFQGAYLPLLEEVEKENTPIDVSVSR